MNKSSILKSLFSLPVKHIHPPLPPPNLTVWVRTTPSLYNKPIYIINILCFSQKCSGCQVLLSYVLRLCSLADLDTNNVPNPTQQDRLFSSTQPIKYKLCRTEKVLLWRTSLVWILCGSESFPALFQDVYPKGVIPLAAIQMARPAKDNKFEIVTSQRIFVFRADNEGKNTHKPPQLWCYFKAVLWFWSVLLP